MIQADERANTETLLSKFWEELSDTTVQREHLLLKSV